MEVRYRNSLCRLCLKTCDSTISLFSMAHLPKTQTDDNLATLKTIFLRTTGVDILKDERFPHHICINCLPVLTKTFLLIETWKRNQIKLQYDYVNITEKARDALKLAEDAQSPEMDEGVITQSEVHFGPETVIIDTIEEEEEAAGEEYEVVGTYEYDQEVAEPEKPRFRYACDECGKQFKERFLLAYHMKIHTDGGHACDVCHRLFNNLNNMRRHVRRVHNNEYNYRCYLCTSKYKSLKNLKNHLKSVHNASPLPRQVTYNCVMCAFSTPSKDEIKVHRKNHKPYNCQYCGKSFSGKREVVVHERVHTNDRPFECTNCNKTFKNSDALTKHMKPRPYSCMNNVLGWKRLKRKGGRVLQTHEVFTEPMTLDKTFLTQFIQINDEEMK